MPKGTVYRKHLKALIRRRDYLKSIVDGDIEDIEANSYDRGELAALFWVVDVLDEVEELEESLNINIVSYARLADTLERSLNRAEDLDTEPNGQLGETDG